MIRQPDEIRSLDFRLVGVRRFFSRLRWISRPAGAPSSVCCAASSTRISIPTPSPFKCWSNPEAIAGTKRAIIHIYNYTSPLQRRVVSPSARHRTMRSNRSRLMVLCLPAIPRIREDNLCAIKSPSTNLLLKNKATSPTRMARSKRPHVGDSPQVTHLMDFIEKSQRGVTR